MKRITFILPFKPQNGCVVFNQKAEQVGYVVEVQPVKRKDESEDHRWQIQAEVNDDTAAEAVQVMEPFGVR